MSWYYASGGQQKGPVDDAQFEAMVSAGQIRATDLVWKEGMANWQPLSSVRPGAGDIPSMAAPPVMGESTGGVGMGAGATGPEATDASVRCVECGGLFSRDNAIQYGTTWVCAACKPVFIQKLKEGTAPGGGAGSMPAPARFPLGPVNPTELAASIRARGYELDIGSCISRAWQLVTANIGIMLGVSALLAVCLFALTILGMIPCVGPLIQVALQGPLTAGAFCFLLRLKREGAATVGDAFFAFSKGWLQLVLLQIVSSIFFVVCFLPAIAAGIAMDERVLPKSVPLIGALAAVGFVPAVYLIVSWAFSSLLIVDRELDFWRAMELSRKAVGLHWWKVLLVLFLMTIVCLSGFVVCIGALFTAPIGLAILAFAYEDIFNEPVAFPFPDGGHGSTQS
jgi:hypothetical protein